MGSKQPPFRLSPRIDLRLARARRKPCTVPHRPTTGSNPRLSRSGLATAVRHLSAPASLLDVQHWRQSLHAGWPNRAQTSSWRRRVPDAGECLIPTSYECRKRSTKQVKPGAKHFDTKSFRSSQCSVIAIITDEERQLHTMRPAQHTLIARDTAAPMVLQNHVAARVHDGHGHFSCGHCGRSPCQCQPCLSRHCLTDAECRHGRQTGSILRP